MADDKAPLYQLIFELNTQLNRSSDRIAELKIDVMSRFEEVRSQVSKIDSIHREFMQSKSSELLRLEGMIMSLQNSEQRLYEAISMLNGRIDRVRSVVVNNTVSQEANPTQHNETQTDMNVGDIDSVSGDVFQGENRVDPPIPPASGDTDDPVT